jgi:hypothetical protein
MRVQECRQSRYDDEGEQMASATLKRDDAAVEVALAQIERQFGRSPEELAVGSAINKRMAADEADPMPPPYDEDAPAATAAEMRDWNAGLAEDGEEPDDDPERVGRMLPHKRWLERKIARRHELRPQVRRELVPDLPARQLGHGRRMPRSRPNGRRRTRAHAAHGPPRRPGGDDPDGDDADDDDVGGGGRAVS